MTEPTPEAIEKLARELDDALDIGGYAMGDGPSSRDYAGAVLAAGYVHLVTYLNGLTASERLELGDALCREAAEMDEDECIDDTDLCEHGLRFGCEDC